MWLNFRQVTKSFAESFYRDILWFQKASLPGNININTLVVLFSFFISNLTCCICANKIYISSMFIVICHMHTAICHIILPYCNICLEMLLKLSKLERTYLIVPDFMRFLPHRGRLGYSHYPFEWLNIYSFRNQ